MFQGCSFLRGCLFSRGCLFLRSCLFSQSCLFGPQLFRTLPAKLNIIQSSQLEIPTKGGGKFFNISWVGITGPGVLSTFRAALYFPCSWGWRSAGSFVFYIIPLACDKGQKCSNQQQDAVESRIVVQLVSYCYRFPWKSLWRLGWVVVCDGKVYNMLRHCALWVTQHGSMTSSWQLQSRLKTVRIRSV